MPILEGVEIKYRNNLAVHKENAQVWYNNDLHKYYDKEDDSVYISCTQLIHKYVPEYDEQWWSLYKAAERLIGDDFVKYKGKLLQLRKITNELLSEWNITEEQLKETQQIVLKEWEDNGGIAVRFSKELESKGYKVINKLDELINIFSEEGE